MSPAAQDARIDLGRLRDLIERLAENGVGVSVRPVDKGTPTVGFMSQDVYDLDGWEVGYITAGGGGELAFGPTLAEAVEAALQAEEHADD